MRDITANDPYRDRPPHDVQDTVRHPPTGQAPTTPVGSPPRRHGIRGLVRAAVIGAVGIAIVSSFAGSVGEGDPKTQRIEGAASRVMIDAGSSDVRVFGTGSGPVEVDLPSRFGRPSARVAQSWSGSTLDLNVVCSGFLGCSSDPVVRVPAGAEVEVRASSGDVRITDVETQVRVETSSGEIDLRDVSNANIRTTSGDVDLQRVGQIDVRATSGDVRGDAYGSSVTTRTTSGDVEMELAQVPRAEVETSSGDIKLDLDPRQEYAIDATTSSGDTDSELRNDDEAPNAVIVRTTSGDIDLRD